MHAIEIATQQQELLFICTRISSSLDMYFLNLLYKSNNSGMCHTIYKEQSSLRND